MRVAWVTRGFLDYRVPVFGALDEILGHELRVIFSSDYVSPRVCAKIEKSLGSRAIGLSGEWRLGPEDRHGMANSGVSLRCQPGLGRAIRACHPDVLIGDGFFKWTFAALCHRILHGTPLVICYEKTFHTERRAQWFRTAYRRIVVRLTGAMCCNGSLCHEYAQWLGMSPSRMTVGHMAADVHSIMEGVLRVTPDQREDLRRRLGIQGVCLMYVGRLIPLKGLVHLLDAWPTVERQAPGQATLVILGDGNQRLGLEGLAVARGLRTVRFAGQVDYDSLAPYYASADAFVIPTLEDNWSLVVPEAMSAGLPILCSKYNGCWPELVHPGRNGWVFDPLDRQDLLRCLRLCLASRDRLREMGRESLAILAEHTPMRAAQAVHRACLMALGR